MKVSAYDPAHIEELASIYNDATRGVPHCYPIDPDELASAVSASVGQGDSTQECLHSELVLVASDHREVLGFIHPSVGRGPDGKGPDRGVIRFFSYRRGHRMAGQALLDIAEDYLRGRGMSGIEAFLPEYRYPFYQLHWSRASDRWDHVRGLLGWKGYTHHSGEVYMDWRDYDPPSAGACPPETDIELHWEDGRGALPNLTVRALRDGAQIGYCACHSGGNYSRHADAQEWVFVRSLNVADGDQGKGVGRYLLLRALAATCDAGYRHAVISTSVNNYRAMLFYGNYGFSAVDWTAAMAKQFA